MPAVLPPFRCTNYNMKLLFRYFAPYRWLVILVLFLAAINIGFSLIDPIIFGKLVTLASNHQVSSTPPGAFDWQRFLTFDPERAFDPNGRGIAMARMMSFATLEYQGRGNVVVASVNI